MMVDPFLDPLDLSPVKMNRFPTQFRGPQRPVETTGANTEFEKLLAEKIGEKPTPVLTEEALRIQEPTATPSPNQNPSDTTSSVLSFNEVNIPIPQNPTPAPGIMNLNVDVHPILPKERTQPRNIQELLDSEKSTAKPDQQFQTTDSSQVKPSENEEQSSAVGTVPENVNYWVKPNDTLSDIVASAMRQRGLSFSTRDIYSMVDTVSAANGIRNPDVIYAGQRIDLSPVYGQPVLAQNQRTISDAPAIEGDVQVPVQGRITSGFGNRIHPILNNEHFHNGIDIAVDEGTPVSPIKPGRVTYSGFQTGLGNVVTVDHGDGDESTYAHLSESFVQVGNRIEKDAMIGLSGNSGRSTGPHLHFEIQRDGVPIDPLSVIPASAFQSPYDTPGEIASGPESGQAE